MGKVAEKEHLNRILNLHLNTIHETLQALNQTADSSLQKLDWNEVIKMGEQVSKQATLVGMLWTGATPEVKALEENMTMYFNVLQGFLLISHGSTVGAGPTLSSCIHASVKQVIDCSFMLWKESVLSYGSHSTEQKLSVPQLVGAVWDACTALKKTPTTNITAVGRGMSQVAVVMKDVLREMKELKPASCDPVEETSDEVSSKVEGEHDEGDNSCEEDLGNDLSQEEMKVAESAIAVVSNILIVVKELIRFITGLLKKEHPDGSRSNVDSLEKLLKLCQGIGVQVDELGACLYPPQEYPAIKAASEKISSMVDEMQVELVKLEESTDAFLQACIGLRKSLILLGSDLDCSTSTDVLPIIENLTLSS